MHRNVNFQNTYVCASNKSRDTEQKISSEVKLQQDYHEGSLGYNPQSCSVHSWMPDRGSPLNVGL
jgi:hypothetical protein